VETVDEALELLTGIAGRRPMPRATEGSLDQRVAQRLKHLAELRRKLRRNPDPAAAAAPTER
jgi:hypothetical protein